MGLDTQTISNEGTYIGVIEGHNLFISDKGKRCPQATLQIKATQKYVSTPEELAHFKREEPGFEPWDSYDEGIIAFLTLYNSGEEFIPDTENLNAGQLAKIVGWEKGDFESLTNDSFIGKQIQFRVELQEYKGKFNLRVTWIDVPGASPDRQLKAIDSSALQALKAKVRGYAKRPAAVSAPRHTFALKAAPPITVVTGADTSTVESLKIAAKAAPTPKSRVKKTVEAVAQVTNSGPTLPPLCTRDEAWETIYAAKGKLSDDEVTDTFIIKTEEVGGNKLEENFTPAEWGIVRDRVLESIEAANIVA
jgi:hypothetical protein